jgi:hypothetical protein
MLHITDGESVAGTLREAAISGTVSIYGDLLYEGPAPGNLDAEEWRETRARFLADFGYASMEDARQSLKEYNDSLGAISSHDEVVIWLDHRLSDQLILIQALDVLSRRSLAGVKLSLICVDRYPGLDRFVGLGQLTADQLTALVNQRQPVTDRQFRLSQQAWNAFTSPDPLAIEVLLEADTSSLPFLADAFRRHLEEFPCVDGGLSRTEREGLSVLHEHGLHSGQHLFVATRRLEEQLFMGDASFYRIMAGLSTCRQPLCRISDTPQAALGEVTITETGRSVMEGRADHIERNGIDRWLGGVHLKGDQAEWRWDRRYARLVSHRSI